jgi:tRNA (adenine22-N1)-methyltransferase
MDVIAGPLGKAAANLALYGMEDRVQLRLSDGLDACIAGEADTLIVTGMGGTLMEEILLRQPEKTASFRALVLGPQSDPEKVRSALRRLGFTITEEELIFEDGKYYPVIRSEAAADSAGERTGDKNIPEKSPVLYRRPAAADPAKERTGDRNTPELFAPDIPAQVRLQAEDLFGPVLLQRRDPVLLEFLRRRTAVLEKILRSIRQAAGDTDKDPALLEKHLSRQQEIEHSLIVYKAALTVFERS